MAFVDKAEFKGSVISECVIDALEYSGILEVINLAGYHLSVDGVCDTDDSGKINDEPGVHQIEIRRSKYVGKMTYTEFKRYVESDLGKAAKKKNSELDLKFEPIGTEFSNTGELTHDKATNNVWYDHIVKFYINKEIVESTDGYIKRLFESLADYILKSTNISIK